jgi:ABC-type Mn2+/Zn2+ transport system permease subunit
MGGEWHLSGLHGLDFEAAFWTIAAGVLCNIACAIVGCFLVLRRMSLLGDAISHAVLPGIVAGALLSGQLTGLPVVIGAVLVGILTAVLAQWLHGFGNVPEDASLGVVFTSLFALGVIMITQAAARIDLDPGCVLYGLIEFIPLDTFDWYGWEIPRAIPALALTLLATVTFVTLLWKELKVVSFDPALATAMGIPAGLVHYLLMGLVAVVTVASFKAVGSIIVIAMLIVPAATAHLLTDRLRWMMLWAILNAVLASVLGYLGAVAWDTSVAGMMAVAAGAQFTVAVIFAPRHGILTKVASNLRLTLRIIREDMLAVLYRAAETAPGPVAPRGLSWKACVQFAGGGLLAWVELPLLWNRGLVNFERGRRLSLTEKGRTRAESLVRSHRLWEAFLEKHFELPLDHLHAPASRLEHYIGPGLQQKLATELDQNTDPHGRAIPPGTKSPES